MADLVPMLPSEIVNRYVDITVELEAIDEVVEEIELRRTVLMGELNSLEGRARSVLAWNSGVASTVSVNGFVKGVFPLRNTYISDDHIITLDGDEELIVRLLKPAFLLQWPEDIAQGATEPVNGAEATS